MSEHYSSAVADKRPGCFKRKRSTYCAASWCENFFGCRIDQPISFFNFPKDRPRANEWLKFALREDLLGGEVKGLRLCSDHFLASDFRAIKPRVLLKCEAVPSQYEWHPLAQDPDEASVQPANEKHVQPDAVACEEINLPKVNGPYQGENIAAFATSNDSVEGQVDASAKIVETISEPLETPAEKSLKTEESPLANEWSVLEEQNFDEEETPIPEIAPVAFTSVTHSCHVSRSAAVEREMNVRVEKVKKPMDFESIFNEKRMKAAELEIKIKEAQLEYEEEKLKELKEKTKRSKEAHEIMMLYKKIEHEKIMENLQKSADR